MRLMPNSRAYRIAAKVLWLWWPSIIMMCCDVGLELVNCTKCSSHFKNKLESVHPLALQQPSDWGGAPLIKVSTIRLRGKIIIGGRWTPAALMAQITVTVWPRHLANLSCTFGGYNLVWSMYIEYSGFIHVPHLTGMKFIFLQKLLYRLKNCCTLGLLKPTARDKFVPCGTRTDRSPNRPKNPCNQSFPALCLFWLNGCFR